MARTRSVDREAKKSVCLVWEPLDLGRIMGIMFLCPKQRVVKLERI